jgi:hypothetical protein
MAEERNLGVARAPEADEDSTKAELQRRMEEARESITQTVTEIKDTVASQYNSVRESVTDALDWREQFRKRPVAWSVGALGVGLVVGYSLGGAFGGDGEDENTNYPEYDETDAFARTGASAAETAVAQSAFTDHRSYAAHAHAIEGGAYGSSEYAAAPAPPPQASAADQLVAPRPSYSSGYDQAPAAEAEDKPGIIERVKDSALLERFKETRAYDRLQEEVSELGNRFMDELSNAARTIVLPALFNKIKELVGVDLSNKGQSGGTSAKLASTPQQSSKPASSSTQGGTQAAASTPVSGSASGASAGAQASSYAKESRSKFDSLAEERTPASESSEVGNRSGNASYDDRYERESQLYARSENRGFGTQPATGESAKGTTPSGSGGTGHSDG